jgi:hypothetical protein
VFLTVLAFSPAVFAQAKETKETKGEEKETEKAADGAKDDEKTDGEATKAPVGAPPPEVVIPHDPTEKPGKTYYFIGARYRQTFLPKFMLGLFVAGGPDSVGIPAFGIEGTMRKDGFDTTLYFTYADWTKDAFAFKGKDEAPNAWEVVTSNLKLLTLGVDLLWGTDFNKSFSFQYGITAGIAAVIGDLKRVQGYVPAGQDPENADNVKPCNGVNNPGGAAVAGGQRFCGDENEHYGDYKEPSWFNGGKKPNIYASFGPQIGIRFKPVKEFVARLNVGWDLFAGPFFGINGSYGL